MFLMFFLCFYLFFTTYLTGGNATLPNIINNFVHTLMYLYYMLSAMGPRYQKYLFWKQFLTELQIVGLSIEHNACV